MVCVIVVHLNVCWITCSDIIFKNIKHAFYQPASERHSLSVLLHFNLKHEILWGKKKTKDIQFFVDVVEASQDLGIDVLEWRFFSKKWIFHIFSICV